MKASPAQSRLLQRRSAWKAWWHLVAGPGPLFIRLLCWSQRNAVPDEHGYAIDAGNQGASKGPDCLFNVVSPAPDALLLDTGDLTIGQAVQRAIELVDSRTHGGSTPKS